MRLSQYYPDAQKNETIRHSRIVSGLSSHVFREKKIKVEADEKEDLGISEDASNSQLSSNNLEQLKRKLKLPTNDASSNHKKLKVSNSITDERKERRKDSSSNKSRENHKVKEDKSDKKEDDKHRSPKSSHETANKEKSKDVSSPQDLHSKSKKSESSDNTLNPEVSKDKHKTLTTPSVDSKEKHDSDCNLTSRDGASKDKNRGEAHHHSSQNKEKSKNSHDSTHSKDKSSSSHNSRKESDKHEHRKKDGHRKDENSLSMGKGHDSLKKNSKFPPDFPKTKVNIMDEILASMDN